MTTYTWPDGVTALTPEAMRWRQLHNNRASVSPLSGYTQTGSLPGMRWGVSLDFPAQPVSQRRALEGHLTRLSGMEHRVSLFDFARRTPRGNAQLSLVTLGAAPAQFATSLTLAGLRAAPNVLRYGSFELDANADGLADGWARYTNGTVGALTTSRSSGIITHGAYSQYLAAASLGATSTDRQGVLRSGDNVALLAGGNCVATAVVLGTLNSSGTLTVVFFDAGAVQVGSITGTAALTTGVQTLTASGACPATAVTAQVYVYQHTNTGGSPSFYVDGVQLEAGLVATPYAGYSTLLSGDWLGLSNGQRVQVVADATADDAGAATVEIRAPLRAALSNGAAVTLDKPTSLFILSEPTLEVPYGAANVCPPFSVNLVEVFA